MSHATIEVEPLNPQIGAEIRGVDLSRPLGNEAVQAIHEALLRHLVIFFRDQDIDLEQQKAFGRRFGKLHIHPTAPFAPGHPEVLVVKADESSKAVAGNRWHTDVSCDVEPPMGSTFTCASCRRRVATRCLPTCMRPTRPCRGRCRRSCRA